MKMAMAVFLLASGWLGLVRADPPDLGRGENISVLEEPSTGAWKINLTEDEFPVIRQAGFTTIRVPISWAAHVAPAAPWTIDPVFMARIDWVVAQAKKNGLNAILDYHNDNKLMADPDGQGDRYVAIWQQIATHFQNEPPTILFELLNEPMNKMDADHWNKLLVRALAVIRPTNPTRAVVVGPVHWNSPTMLPKLVLPEDDQNLIVTFHYYDPMSFTHQGAGWVAGSDKWLGTVWKGTDADKAVVISTFDRAQAWGREHRRPMFLGEFGAYKNGDMASRARWVNFVARTAESYGFSWACWEFCEGFGAYDPVAKQWREPLLRALMPGK
jgi:endoglucanase